LINDSEAALDVYSQAVEILPNDLLLNFTYAELLESRKRANEAINVYHKLINSPDLNQADYTLSVIQYLKFLQRSEGPNTMRKEFIASLESGKCTFHLPLAVASIENYVNVNPDAASRILTYSLERYGNEPEFFDAAVSYLIKFEEYDKVSSFISGAQKYLSQEEMKKLYKEFYKHLLYIRGKESLLKEIESAILKLDQTETQQKMMLRRFFLPDDFDYI